MKTLSLKKFGTEDILLLLEKMLPSDQFSELENALEDIAMNRTEYQKKLDASRNSGILTHEEVCKNL